MSAHERYKVTARIGPYMLTHTLGRGNFSVVKLAIHETTFEQFACKIINKSLIIDRSISLQGLQREVEVMRTVQHPNTVRLIDVLNSATKVFIVMEFVTGGELYSEIARYGRLPEPYARFLFQQLIDGLQHCHEHGVYHRDLKPDNILLEEDKTLKITDFGLSTLKGTSSNCPNVDLVTDPLVFKTQCGSPFYVAPEIVSKTSYLGPKVDAWACGIILYTLVRGKHPFDSDNKIVLFDLILECNIKYPPFFSEDLIDLIGHVLTKDPTDRYSLAQIRAHPWFNGRVERAVYSDSDVPTYLIPYDPHPISNCSTPVKDPAPYSQCTLTEQSPQEQKAIPFYPQLPPYQTPKGSVPTLDQQQAPQQHLPQTLEAVPYNAESSPGAHRQGNASVPYEQLSTSEHVPARRDVVRAGQGQAYLLSQCANCQGSNTDSGSEYDASEEITDNFSPNHNPNNHNGRAFCKKSFSWEQVYCYDDGDAEYLGRLKKERDVWNRNPQNVAHLAGNKAFLGDTLDAFSRSANYLRIPKLARARSHDSSIVSRTVHQWTRERYKAVPREYVAGGERSFVSRETVVHLLKRERMEGEDLHRDFQQQNSLMKVSPLQKGRSLKLRTFSVRFKEHLGMELEERRRSEWGAEWEQTDFDKMLWCREMDDFDMVPDICEFGIDSSTLNDMWTAALGDENIGRRECFPATADAEEFGADSFTLNDLWTEALGREDLGRQRSFSADQFVSPVICAPPTASYELVPIVCGDSNEEDVLISEAVETPGSHGHSEGVLVELKMPSLDSEVRHKCISAGSVGKVEEAKAVSGSRVSPAEVVSGGMSSVSRRGVENGRMGVWTKMENADKHLRLGGGRDLLSEKGECKDDADAECLQDGCQGADKARVERQVLSKLLLKSTTFDLMEDEFEAEGRGGVQEVGSDSGVASAGVVDGGCDARQDDEVEEEKQEASGKESGGSKGGPGSGRNMNSVNPFLMELPGPRLGTSEPKTGIGVGSIMPNMDAVRLFRKNASSWLRGNSMTQFHSVLSPERCCRLIQDVLKEDCVGCEVEECRGRTKDRFKMKWVMRKDGVKVGGRIEISKRDDLLSDVVLRKNVRSNVGHFNDFFSDVHDKFCERRKVMDGTKEWKGKGKKVIRKVAT